jgi:HSP20 family protein
MKFLARRQDAWDPFRDFGDLQREMNHLFSQLSGNLVPQESGASNGAWTVPLDISETKDRIQIKADLPGITPDEIDVSVQGTTLLIKAQRKYEEETKEENFYRKELAYGVLHRQVELPSSVDPEKLQARYKNGVLELTLLKREEVKPKQIKVQVN